MHPIALPAQRHLPAVLAASLPLAGWAATTTVLTWRLDAARRDPLTGLMTRDTFTSRAARLIARRAVLVVLVDLDGFKALNDSRGHAAGDAVLAHTAHRLRATVTPAGAAGRFGGDEFTAALPTDPDDALYALACLHYQLTEPTPYGKDLLPVGASVGGYLATPGTPLADALTAADAAMYAAKRRGGGWELSEHPAPTYTAAPRRWRRHRTASEERCLMSIQPMGGRCPAAHREDHTSCEGPADAVVLRDREGVTVAGCVHHIARMLASIARAEVGPGSVPGAAADAFERAAVLSPFCWLREVER